MNETGAPPARAPRRAPSRFPARLALAACAALALCVPLTTQYLLGWPLAKTEAVSRLRHDDGVAYRGGLPHPVNRIAVLENGRPLCPTPSRGRTQSSPGNFTYKPGSRCFYFSARDGSDPATNGREYRVRFGVAIPPAAPVAAAAIALLLGSVPLTLTLRRHAPTLALCLCIAAAFAKLCVTADDEARIVHGDCSSYVAQTVTPPWQAIGGLPSHPRGFPAFVAVITATGLPYRVGVELVYLAACALAAFQARALLRSRALATLLFLFLAWHPWTLNRFSVFMPGPLLLVILLLLWSALCSLLLPATRARPTRAIALFTLCLAMWEWSRHETPLLVATAAAVIAAAFVARPFLTPAPPARALVAGFALSLALLVASALAIRGLNAVWYGIPAKSQVEQPSLFRLMKALYRIRPDETILYAPVTRQSLQLACAHSPTLARFQEALLEPDGTFARAGGDIAGRPGELASFLNWQLSTVFAAGTREGDHALAEAAHEVECALADGRLPRRAILFPFDPCWPLWMRQLPRHFLYALRNGLDPSRAGETPDPPQPILPSAYYDDYFDRATNRRARHATSRALDVCCTIPGGVDKIDALTLVAPAGNTLASVRALPNPDEPATALFRVVIPHPPPADSLRLALTRGARTIATADLARVIQTIDVDAGTGTPLNALVTLRTPHRHAADRYVATRVTLSRWYPILLALAALAVALAGFLAAPAAIPPLVPALLAALSPLLWIVLRAGLFALIDANFGWDCTQDRYVGCVSPVPVLSFLALPYLAGATLARRRARRAPPEPLHAPADPIP